MNWNNLVAAADIRYQTMVDNLVVPNHDFAQVAFDDEMLNPPQHALVQDIYDCANRNQIMLGLTGFNVPEFEDLFSIVRPNILLPNRGRRPKLSPKDSFFVTLYFLKTYNKLEEISATFHISRIIWNDNLNSFSEYLFFSYIV